MGAKAILHGDLKRVVALLAAAILTGALGACGGGGAEPGAPERATLVLDFQPNAAHAGIYAALAEGYYRRAGVSLDVQVPSASTDAPKLLEAGRADFAIMDIHDLAIARERGFDVVAVAPIVDRPLASVIARDPASIRRPCDLEGRTVGVTGLPSDDAVLDSELRADGCDPAGVHTVTIGFDAVASLAAGKVDAATAFWNAEGVTLERRGVPVRVFRVDDYGAPRYPELLLCTSGQVLSKDAQLVAHVVQATGDGYAFAVKHPGQAVGDLVDSVAGLSADEEAAQLRALLRADALPSSGPPFDPSSLRRWAGWELRHGIVHRPIDVAAMFQPPTS
jgi:NitT/TauT family transport system substrate-binding protein/putative hydroxymethylpyrimidine transport system substrate-binding protein